MNILKRAREKLNLTQEDMSQKLKISKKSISSYEQGVRYIRVHDLIDVADAYELSDEEIIQYLKQLNLNKKGER